MKKNTVHPAYGSCRFCTYCMQKKKTTSEPTPTPAPATTPAQVADAIPNAVLNATPTPASTPMPTPKPTRSPAPETPMPLATAAPTPVVTEAPSSSATPAAAAAAQSEGPVITKQPNGEGHYIGESVVFTAEARTGQVLPGQRYRPAAARSTWGPSAKPSRTVHRPRGR